MQEMHQSLQTCCPSPYRRDRSDFRSPPFLKFFSRKCSVTTLCPLFFFFFFCTLCVQNSTQSINWKFFRLNEDLWVTNFNGRSVQLRAVFRCCCNNCASLSFRNKVIRKAHEHSVNISITTFIILLVAKVHSPSNFCQKAGSRTLPSVCLFFFFFKLRIVFTSIFNSRVHSRLLHSERAGLYSKKRKGKKRKSLKK